MGDVPTTSHQSDDGVHADSQRGRHADERDAAADERESERRAREARAQAKEALEASRRGEVLEILDAGRESATRQPACIPSSMTTSTTPP